jgi:hypothetical protein
MVAGRPTVLTRVAPVVIYLLEMLFSYYNYSREVPVSTIKSSSE